MSILSEQEGKGKKKYYKMYKTFFENNLMPCAILDSNFNFVRVNTAYARAGNRSPAKLIGKNISDLYPSDIKEIFKQVVATKTSYRTQTRPFESPYNKGQGLTYWDWSIEPVLDDDQEVAYLIFMLYEVTKRVKAARELDNFFNLSVDLLGMIDFQGKLIKINTYFAKILGYLEKELVNRSLFSLIHEDDRVKMEEDFNNAVSTNQPIVNLENRCRQKDQTYKHIQWVIVPDKEQNLCYVVGHDITEQKKLHAELNRLETLSMLGAITAEINHELRNPIATIRGILQLFFEKEDCQKHKVYLELMMSEIDRANSIIVDYLAFAKVSNLQLERRNLNEIVERVLLLIENNILSSSVTIKTVLKDIPDILADEKVLAQLIINLVQNGIEAMGNQGEITISTCFEEGKVVLAVSDQGQGIAPEIIDKLGTPFLTTKENGVGLGLSICYRIAKNHNAKIDVETSSSGTTFFVKFNQA